MRQHLVYDLPLRLFHWLFAGLFLIGFTIAKTVDDESVLFNYHSLAGLTLGFLVLLRVVWGVFGTKHARFSGFALNPKDLVSYFLGILAGEKKRWAGHNPASSWAGLIMMLMALGLAVTGYLMASGSENELLEDFHELLANGFIVVVGLHVVGIGIHTIRTRELIGLSMIDGKKESVTPDQTITSSKASFGILLIGLVIAFGFHLFKNYNSQTRTLELFGTTLQLGENEGAEHGVEQGDDHGDEHGDNDAGDE